MKEYAPRPSSQGIVRLWDGCAFYLNSAALLRLFLSTPLWVDRTTQSRRLNRIGVIIEYPCVSLEASWRSNRTRIVNASMLRPAYLCHRHVLWWLTLMMYYGIGTHITESEVAWDCVTIKLVTSVGFTSRESLWNMIMNGIGFFQKPYWYAWSILEMRASTILSPDFVADVRSFLYFVQVNWVPFNDGCLVNLGQLGLQKVLCTVF